MLRKTPNNAYYRVNGGRWHPLPNGNLVLDSEKVGCVPEIAKQIKDNKEITSLEIRPHFINGISLEDVTKLKDAISGSQYLVSVSLGYNRNDCDKYNTIFKGIIANTNVLWLEPGTCAQDLQELLHKRRSELHSVAARIATPQILPNFHLPKQLFNSLMYSWDQSFINGFLQKKVSFYQTVKDPNKVKGNVFEERCIYLHHVYWSDIVFRIIANRNGLPPEVVNIILYFRNVANKTQFLCNDTAGYAAHIPS